MKPGISNFQGALIVLLTGVVFSFGGLAFRTTTDITAWEYVAFRGAGAAVVAGVVLISQHRRRLPTVIQSVQRTHLLAGALLGLTSCVFIVALEVTTVAFILFLQTISPITAAYFSWIILKERVSAKVSVATAVTMAGVGVMVAGTFSAGVEPAGLIAIFIPISFGLYATMIRSASTIDPTVPVFASGITMVVVGVSIAFVTGGFDPPLSDAFVGLFSGSVLLGLPLALFNRAQRVVPAPETALLLMSEVVLAPIWVWLFVDEKPETTTLVGGAIILAAVAWLTMSRVPRKGRVLTSRG